MTVLNCHHESASHDHRFCPDCGERNPAHLRGTEMFGVDEHGDRYDLEPVTRHRPSEY